MNIDQQLLLDAVVKQESGGNPNAVSPKGAAGIMQIMPDTARQPGYGVQPLQGWDGVDPRTASVEEQMRFGNDYLNAMKAQHNGNTELALAAYNAGPGAVQQYGGIPPYEETQNYVKSITQDVQNRQGQLAQLDVQWDDDNVVPQLEVQWDEPAENTWMQDMREGVQNRHNQILQAEQAYNDGEQSYAESLGQGTLSYLSNIPDMLMTTAEHATPDFIKDAGSKVLDAGTFLAANTVGEVPVPFTGNKLREELPWALSNISKGDTRLDRNLRSVGQAVGLVPAAKSLDLLGEGAVAGTKKIMNTAPVKEFIADESSTAALRITKAQETAAKKTAADMGKLATQSYDEASYLGAKFNSGAVGDRIDTKLGQLKAKPLPNGKFTTEDLELNRHVDEITGLTGKELSLDDVQRLDQSLTQKINKFVDPKTGNLDANGRKLFILQKDLRNIVDEADTAGNNALINGRHFYRAQMMMNDLEAAAERASMNTTNVGKALQREYKKLYLDKDRTKNWPEDVRAQLKRAAEPGAIDEVVDFFGSRLPALIGLGSGNLPMAATAHVAGVASRGAKEAMIARRGAKVQQSIVDDTLGRVKNVDIPEPTVADQLLLPSPGKIGPRPMTDGEVKRAQKQTFRTNKNTSTNGGSPIKLSNSREAIIEEFKSGKRSMNKFIEAMSTNFGMTKTQAKKLAKELKEK